MLLINSPNLILKNHCLIHTFQPCIKRKTSFQLPMLTIDLTRVTTSSTIKLMRRPFWMILEDRKGRMSSLKRLSLALAMRLCTIRWVGKPLMNISWNSRARSIKVKGLLHQLGQKESFFILKQDHRQVTMESQHKTAESYSRFRIWKKSWVRINSGEDSLAWWWVAPSSEQGWVLIKTWKKKAKSMYFLIMQLRGGWLMPSIMLSFKVRSLLAVNIQALNPTWSLTLRKNQWKGQRQQKRMIEETVKMVRWILMILQGLVMYPFYRNKQSWRGSCRPKRVLETPLKVWLSLRSFTIIHRHGVWLMWISQLWQRVLMEVAQLV